MESPLVRGHHMSRPLVEGGEGDAEGQPVEEASEVGTVGQQPEGVSQPHVEDLEVQEE